MKNLLIILFVFIGLTTFSQRVYTDSIDVSTISGADTMITIPFRSESGSSIEFDFTNFDADDAILDFGYINNRCFSRADDNRLPLTLSTALYDYTTNCSVSSGTYAGVILTNIKWNSKYIVFKLTLTSVTTGTFIYSFIR